jgi:hypothetical protein
MTACDRSDHAFVAVEDLFECRFDAIQNHLDKLRVGSLGVDTSNIVLIVDWRD